MTEHSGVEKAVEVWERVQKLLKIDAQHHTYQEIEARIAHALAAIQPFLVQPEGEVDEDVAERIARAFHGVYETLAPEFGYESRPESRVPWSEVPEKNRALMIGTVRRLILTGVIAASPQPENSGEKLQDWIKRLCAMNSLVCEEVANYLEAAPAQPEDRGGKEDKPKALTLEQKAAAEIEGAAAGQCPFCEGGMDALGGIHKTDCPMLARPVLKKTYAPTPQLQLSDEDRERVELIAIYLEGAAHLEENDEGSKVTEDDADFLRKLASRSVEGEAERKLAKIREVLRQTKEDDQLGGTRLTDPLMEIRRILSSQPQGDDAREELTMIALALKNEGIENCTPEEGVERLVTLLAAYRTEEHRRAAEASDLRSAADDLDVWSDTDLKDWACLLLALEADGWRVLRSPDPSQPQQQECGGTGLVDQRYGLKTVATTCPGCSDPGCPNQQHGEVEEDAPRVAELERALRDVRFHTGRGETKDGTIIEIRQTVDRALDTKGGTDGE